MQLFESPETLLALLKNGDPDAQKLFWQRSWNDVYAVTLNILENSPDATEVTVDVMSDFLFDYVHRINKASALQSYLRIVAARRAVRFRRQKNAATSDGQKLESLVDLDTKSPEESVYLSGLVTELNHCLKKLTPKAQQVLHLRFQREFTNENIGTLLGGSKQYIGRLITRSISVLRECLRIRTTRPFSKRQKRGTA